MRRHPSSGLLIVVHPVLLGDELSGPAIHLAGTRRGLRKRRYVAAIARSPLLERLAVGGASPVPRALVKFVGTILTPWVLAGMCIRSHSLPYIRHYHTLTSLYWMLWLARRPFAVEVNATLFEEPHALRRWPAPLLGLAESVEMAALRRAAAVVAVSGVLRDRLVGRGLEASRVTAVHNGCECEELAEPAEPDPGTVAYVGSFRPWHRVNLLVEALAEIPADVPARLVLAGPGDTERLLTTAVRLGVSERVSLPGKTARDDVARLMRSAAVLVLPNTADYGSPLKLFEYLASGRPCVLPDLPNIREVVGDGESAFLFEPGNPKALAAAVEDALTNPSAPEVGRRGRDLVCSRYTWSENAERIVAALGQRPSTALEPGRPGGAAPLRVLMAGPLPPPLGGATVALASLVASLDSRSDVDLRTVDTSRIRGRGLRTPRAFVGMLRRAWGEMDGVDVVALHASATALHLAVPAFVWLARRRGVPLIVRRFGGSTLETIGGLRRRAAVGGLRRADLFLVETRALVDDAEAAGLERVRQLPNSRPMPLLDEPEVPNEPCTRFVFVGHVRSEKGVLELIAAGEKLEGEVVVDVFGTLGHDIDLLAFAGLSRVRYMGSLKPEDVHDTLCRYDCLVLPSYYEGEGHPGVILEAYAAGLPVVATRWRAIPELVDDGSCGLLVEPRDPDSLYDGMLSLVEDGELCACLRAGVRDKRGVFSDDIWHEQFVGYCRDLAAGARKAALEADASGRAGIGRYFRTVRHLKSRQIWMRVLRRTLRPRVAARPHPAVRAPSRPLAQTVPRADGWLAPDRVRLLNIERSFESGIDWRPADASRLWTYHLNYFEDLPQSAGRPDKHRQEGFSVRSQGEDGNLSFVAQLSQKDHKEGGCYES